MRTLVEARRAARTLSAACADPAGRFHETIFFYAALAPLRPAGVTAGGDSPLVSWLASKYERIDLKVHK